MCPDIRKTPFRPKKIKIKNSISVLECYQSLQCHNIAIFSPLLQWGSPHFSGKQHYEEILWHWKDKHSTDRKRREKQGWQTSSFSTLGAFCYLFCERISQCFLGWNKMSTFRSSIGMFICECCFPFLLNIHQAGSPASREKLMNN